MKNEIRLQYVTRKDTTTPEFGRAFLDILVNRHPQLGPEFYDTRPERECTNPFVSIEEALPKWAFRGIITEISNGIVVDESPIILGNFIKRRKSIKYYAAIEHTRNTRYGNPVFGVLSFDAAKNNKIDWLSVFIDFTKLIEPVLARMHIFTDTETKNMIFGSPESLFWAGPSQPEMRDGLTNLGWANVFSEEYASEVDEERLRAHGFSVEAVPGGKLFTVTDDLFDVVNDFAAFSRRRAELKSLFRPGLFQITDEPELPTT